MSSTIANGIRRSFTHDGMDDTGCPLKVIKTDFVKKIPKDEKFGLLVDLKEAHQLNKAFPTHTIELIEEFDLNYFNKKRNRLIRKYYLIAKNTTFE